MNVKPTPMVLLLCCFLPLGCGPKPASIDELAIRMVEHAKTKRGKIILHADGLRRIWSDGAFLEVGVSFPNAIEEMLKTPTHKHDISSYVTGLESKMGAEWTEARFERGLNSAGLANVVAVSSSASAEIEPLYRDYLLRRYPGASLRIRNAASPTLVVIDGRIVAAVMPQIQLDP